MTAILKILEQTYGSRPWKCWSKGVDVLVDTILSQNTTAKNSDAGYKRLRRQFRHWNQVMNAPVDEVEKAIRVCGLSRQKAPRIQSILRQIKNERGKIDLQFLADWDVDAAYDYLLKFKGVGPKTANCVLLFAFGKGVFPVDTHIHRIAKRMGWIGENATEHDAHRLLRPMIAEKNRYAMHVLLIEHGRKRCKARTPLCQDCALRTMCGYGSGASGRARA